MQTLFFQHFSGQLLNSCHIIAKLSRFAGAATRQYGHTCGSNFICKTLSVDSDMAPTPPQNFQYIYQCLTYLPSWRLPLLLARYLHRWNAEADEFHPRPRELPTGWWWWYVACLHSLKQYDAALFSAANTSQLLPPLPPSCASCAWTFMTLTLGTLAANRVMRESRGNML